MNYPPDSMSSPKDSPLSTRELRNRLLRRPLHDDTPLFRQPEEPSASASRQLGRTLRGAAAKANSPPNSQFRTSSPMDGGPSASNVVKHENISPGMSMIAPAKVDPDSSPKTRRGAKKKTSSFQLSLSDAQDDGEAEEEKDKEVPEKEDEEEEEEDGSDDSQQPSATVVTHRSRQGRTTAAKIRGRPARAPVLSKSAFLQELRNEEDDIGICRPASFIFGIIVAIILVSSVAFILTQFEESRNIFSQFEDQSNTGQNWSERVEQFQNELKRWQKAFPGQDKNAWTIVAASIKRVLRPYPVQPSVLLFVSEPDASAVSRCLAKEVVEGTRSILGKGSGSQAYHGKEFPTKNDLFNSMQQSLNDTASFLLLQLEDLPGSSAMALHALCDNINAPYKRATIALTLTVEKIGKDENAEAAAERVLGKAWSKDLDEDRLSPILNRIMVSVVYVKEESAQNKLCTLQ